jgi:membrane-associated protease RseP (regulator of RpoE activity)
MKALVDQFVYVPLWAAPSQVLLFAWKDAGFSVEKTRAAFQRQSLGQRLLVVIFSTWVVWLPAVAIVYSLPLLLQVPLFNLVLCFWCLLMSFISSQGDPAPPTAVPAPIEG